MIKKFDIITLANNSNYAVIEMIEHNEKKYALLMEVNEKEEKLQEAEMKISEIVTDSENNNRLIELTEESLLEELKIKFQEIL